MTRAVIGRRTLKYEKGMKMRGFALYGPHEWVYFKQNYSNFRAHDCTRIQRESNHR